MIRPVFEPRTPPPPPPSPSLPPPATQPSLVSSRGGRLNDWCIEAVPNQEYLLDIVNFISGHLVRSKHRYKMLSPVARVMLFQTPLSHGTLLRDCLCGLVVKRPPRELLTRVWTPLSPVESSSDLRIGTQVATLPAAWRYKVNARTGWPDVSRLSLGAIVSLICNF